MKSALTFSLVFSIDQTHHFFRSNEDGPDPRWILIDAYCLGVYDEKELL